MAARSRCALAAEGAKVVGTATTDEGAASIAAYLKDAGNAGTGLKLDVTDAAATESVLAAIDGTHGAITILVNNAGITRDNLLLRMKDDEWDAIMATNLKPAYRLAKAVLRGMMKARQGRIIQIGSVVGSSGNAGQVNYSAAKAALIGFTKSLAQEVGSRNITVNCVAPGFIDTDMTTWPDRRPARGVAGQDSARPPGLAGGRRACGRIPCQPRRRIRHRDHAARERRHVHGLNSAGASRLSGAGKGAALWPIW